jgi:hypothetical protein
MAHLRVMVAVGVRLSGGGLWAVGVPMMLVVDVAMLVIERQMDVLMLMSLRQMQIDADPHQPRRTQEDRRDRLAEQDDRGVASRKGAVEK